MKLDTTDVFNQASVAREEFCFATDVGAFRVGLNVDVDASDSGNLEEGLLGTTQFGDSVAGCNQNDVRLLAVSCGANQDALQTRLGRF